MKTTDIPFLRGDVMPEQKSKLTAAKVEPVAPAPAAPAATGLAPASETTNPAVQQLLAEMATLRANGANEDAQEIVSYLAELGYSAS